MGITHFKSGNNRSNFLILYSPQNDMYVIFNHTIEIIQITTVHLHNKHLVIGQHLTYISAKQQCQKKNL